MLWLLESVERVPRQVREVIAAADRRRAVAKKAWTEAYMRLDARTEGKDVPNLSYSSATMMAEVRANVEVAAYVEGSTTATPRKALEEWEKLAAHDIDTAMAKRGCNICGHEKVVEVVDVDGGRCCGRCRAGIPTDDHGQNNDEIP